MKATIYPNLFYNEKVKANPYIKDFISALYDSGIQIANPPHKNPLFSICFKIINSDFYFFHWIEDVTNHKFGYLQAFMAVIFIVRIKLHGKKIIWFLHNKSGHTTRHIKIRKLLVKILTKSADYIITHASDGLEIIEDPYKKKVIFIDHPTKNRIKFSTESKNLSPAFDLLIWGSISRYKGVLEFLRFAKKTDSPLKIKIVGKCKDNQLCRELLEESTELVDIENRSISFEELCLYIENAKFVLIPYSAESILSSGILMDSLSFGAKVIGPDVGSFRDYASSSEVNVYTFAKFDDIEYIVSLNVEPVSIEGYTRFLQRNSWSNFAKKISDVIQS
ncbi:MAG: glycosyltransferase [Bacteroides sp.]|nr:glycosyltransferase [Bacteroides sp.]